MRCLLCETSQLQALHHQQWPATSFYLCGECDLIFREPASVLGWSEQKARYDLHRNSSSDAGYMEYLQQLIRPLVPLLRERNLSQGVDWGSGPGPSLSEAMKHLGFQVENYDPIYHPVTPQGPLDFILSTEVIEHFTEPRRDMREIFALLRTNGIFAGMTQFHQGLEHFSTWWYGRDPTHICFYSEKTFLWVARHLQCKILALEAPVFIFEKILVR